MNEKGDEKEAKDGHWERTREREEIGKEVGGGGRWRLEECREGEGKSTMEKICVWSFVCEREGRRGRRRGRGGVREREGERERERGEERRGERERERERERGEERRGEERRERERERE